MRKLILILALLLSVYVNAEEFDLPLKISWNTGNGLVSREISSEGIIEVSNALGEDRKKVSFKLEVTAVVRDVTSPKLALISYWCVVERVDDVEYISVREADIISVNGNEVGYFECGNNYKVNVEWVNKSSKKDVLTHASS